MYAITIFNTVDKPTIIRGCQPVNVTQQLETEEGCITEEEVELTACSGACGSSTNVLPYHPFLEVRILKIYSFSTNVLLYHFFLEVRCLVFNISFQQMSYLITPSLR